MKFHVGTRKVKSVGKQFTGVSTYKEQCEALMFDEKRVVEKISDGSWQRPSRTRVAPPLLSSQRASHQGYSWRSGWRRRRRSPLKCMLRGRATRLIGRPWPGRRRNRAHFLIENQRPPQNCAPRIGKVDATRGSHFLKESGISKKFKRFENF